MSISSFIKGIARHQLERILQAYGGEVVSVIVFVFGRNVEGKESIPLFWRLFNAYGYNCYFIFDGDGKATENTRIFKGIINTDIWETAAEKYVKTSKYAYFGVDFEKYFRASMTEYGSLEQQITEKYHVTSKPGKAKAIAQHCEEIPSLITELKQELEIIELLG